VSGKRAAVLAAEMACLAYAQLGALGAVRAALPSYPEMVELMHPAASEVIALRRAAKRARGRKRGTRLRRAEQLLACAADRVVEEIVAGLVSSGGAPGVMEVPRWAPFRVDEWPLDPAGRAA